MIEVKRFFVTGRVQGVYYRVNTQRKASALGLKGWVRNLPDGRVEVLAGGEASAMSSLEEWLWRGPEHARVDDVAAETAGAEQLAACHDFGIA